MVSANDPRLVGFLEINLGRTKVKVPIREANDLEGKDAAFAADTHRRRLHPRARRRPRA
jgi:hypothetical protein